ncbi:hypothetical protein [Pseudofrankia sp. DC12]|uniref:hypothetical protein n=1 Tax=Pseudofrankia sp. DC12 TaxID=683315 RepID=UPI000B1ACB53|nr:hypothetical protein [Pseudofrankia sp. DC12]
MGWHARAEELVRLEGPVLEAALMLLEHAASGLLHRPAFDSLAGASALADVDLAVFRLEIYGLRVPPSFPVGGDRVEARDVRPVLDAAAARLATGLTTAADPMQVARAGIFTREALAALGDD